MRQELKNMCLLSTRFFDDLTQPMQTCEEQGKVGNERAGEDKRRAADRAKCYKPGEHGQKNQRDHGEMPT